MCRPTPISRTRSRKGSMISAVANVRPSLEKFYGLLDDEQKTRLNALAEDQRKARATTASLAQSCGNMQAQAFQWPSGEVDARLHPNDTQRAALGVLQDASAKAANMLKTECQPEDLLTPPARLAAIAGRLDVMLQAVKLVRPALEDFYATLSDEQKAQFNATGEDTGPRADKTRRGAAQLTSAQVCAVQTSRAAAWPQKQIEETVQPTEAQRAALDNLGTAAAKAADLLKDSCPTQALATPTGRLAAVKARLGAMLEAVKIERPALENFYGSLSDEQKARFNAIGRQQQPDHQG